MKKLVFALVAAALVGFVPATDAAGREADVRPGAFRPVRPRLGGWWRTFTTRSEGAAAGVVDLVMVGDSITQGWVDAVGRDVLKARFGDLRVASLGVSGNSVEDQLGTCLWGGLDGYRAKVVQVMIGTNNAGQNRPERTADGIRQLLAVIRAKQPQARIVLIPIFPRGKAGDRCRAENEQVNAIIRGFADGKSVVWKDFSDRWLDAAGNCTTNLMKDLLHPNAKGYELWADEVRPLVDRLRAEVGDLVFTGIPCVANRPVAPKAPAKVTDGAEVLFVGDDVRDIHRDVMHRDPWTPEFYRDYESDLWNFDEPTEALLGRLGEGRRPYGIYVICAGRANVRLRDGAHEPPIDTYVGIKAMVQRIVAADPKARVLVLPPRVLPSDSAEQAERLEAVEHLLRFLPREVERVVTLPRDARAVKAAIGCMIPDGARSRPRESVFCCVAHPDDMIACAGTMLLLKDRFDIHEIVLTHGDRGSAEIAARRTKEEESAAAMLGAHLYWGNERDGHAYASEATCRQVADLLKKIRPRAVFAMSPVERHPDHAISSAVVNKAIDLAGMRDKVELYFMEEAYDSRSFVPAHYVDITEVLDQKRAYIRKSVSENAGDGMCRDEIVESLTRGQRLANWVHHEYGRVPEINGHFRIAAAERFAQRDGKPQGARCIFNELPLPKGGWNQDWDDPAKLW